MKLFWERDMKSFYYRDWLPFIYHKKRILMLAFVIYFGLC